MKKNLFCLFAGIFFLLSVAVPCFAEESIPLMGQEGDVYGLLPQTNNSSLSWEQTIVTYDLSDFKKDNLFHTTKNEVTTTYFIRNTSNTEQTEEFLLPYYEVGDTDYKKSNTTITVDGDVITPKERHFISAMNLYYDDEMRLLNTYMETDLFKPYTNVHKLKATAYYSSTQDGTISHEFKSEYVNPKTVVTKNGYISSFSGNTSYTFTTTKEDPTFELYFIGEVPKLQALPYNLTIEESDMTLLDFTTAYMPQNVSKLDWYNIVVQRLNNYYGSQTLDNLMSKEQLMHILTFDVTFPPRKSRSIITNMPILPYYIHDSESTGIFSFFGCQYSGNAQVLIYVHGSGDITRFTGGEFNSAFDAYQMNNNVTYSFRASTAIVDNLTNAVLIALGTLLIFFFYIVPMIIMLILFFHNKNKTGKKLLYIEKFLSYTLAFFGFISLLFLENSLAAAIVLSCGLGILTALTVTEILKRITRDFSKLLIETICWVTMICSWATMDISGSFVCLWLFNTALFVLLLFRIRKKNREMMPATFTLPVGMLYDFESWITYLYCTITITLAFVLSDLYGNFGHFILGIVLIVILYYFGMAYKNAFLFLGPIRRYKKHLDFDKLEQEVHQYQSLPRIHPETINYYTILLTQFSLLHSQDKCKEYFSKCHYPKHKPYIFTYRGLILRYGMTKAEFDHSYDVLKKEYYNKKRILKAIDKFYQFWLPYYGVNPTTQISKIYNYQRKNDRLSNAISLFVLIYYYKNEGNQAKVEELKKLFLKEYSMLEEFVKDLEKL